MRLKILTYNIHKGFSVGNRRFVLHQIKEAIHIVHADLVFLQEIQGVHVGHAARIQDWPSAPLFEFLADTLWPHYAYGKNALYDKGHHGNAILSRFPFVEWENIDVSLHKKASRSVLHGVLQPPGMSMRIHAICVHFGLFKTERDAQFRVLCERIASHVPSDEPLIVAGDFNDWRGHGQYYLQMYLNLEEAFHSLSGRYARTFPAWKPFLPVDRIYFRNFTVQQAQRLAGVPWRRLSDHVALYSELEYIDKNKKLFN